MCASSGLSGVPAPARVFEAVFGSLSRLFGGRKDKRDKEQASSVALCSVTSARSAGSYGGFRGVPKWGQNRKGAITSAVVIPESLQPQRKNGGHALERNHFEQESNCSAGCMLNRQNVENESTGAVSRTHTAESNHPYVDRTWSLSTTAYKLKR